MHNGIQNEKSLKHRHNQTELVIYSYIFNENKSGVYCMHWVNLKQFNVDIKYQYFVVYVIPLLVLCRYKKLIRLNLTLA